MLRMVSRWPTGLEPKWLRTAPQCMHPPSSPSGSSNRTIFYHNAPGNGPPGPEAHPTTRPGSSDNGPQQAKSPAIPILETPHPSAQKRPSWLSFAEAATTSTTPDARPESAQHIKRGPSLLCPRAHLSSSPGPSLPSPASRRCAPTPIRLPGPRHREAQGRRPSQPMPTSSPTPRTASVTASAPLSRRHPQHPRDRSRGSICASAQRAEASQCPSKSSPFATRLTQQPFAATLSYGSAKPQRATDAKGLAPLPHQSPPGLPETEVVRR